MEHRKIGSLEVSIVGLGRNNLGRILDGRRFIRFADGRGRTLLELAFAWLLAKRPIASVIAGATTAEQVLANVEASGWRLGGEELAALEEL